MLFLVQSHDGAFAELFIELGEDGIEGFFLVIKCCVHAVERETLEWSWGGPCGLFVSKAGIVLLSRLLSG